MSGAMALAEFDWALLDEVQGVTKRRGVPPARSTSSAEAALGIALEYPREPAEAIVVRDFKSYIVSFEPMRLPARQILTGRTTTSEVAAAWEPRVRELVEEGLVRAARDLVEQLRRTVRGSPELDRWEVALKPPQLIGSAPASSPGISRDADWLRRHSAGYAGKWVALRDGRLLGSDESRAVLRERLGQASQLRGALLVKVPR